MSVIRVEKSRNYTTVCNDLLRDKRLSMKGRGLLMTMLSLPPDWDYTVKGLATLSHDGVASIRTGLVELEELGYLVREQQRDAQGRLGQTEYVIYEVAQPVTSSVNPPVTPSTSHSQPSCENRITEEKCKSSERSKPARIASERVKSPLCENRITVKPDAPLCDFPLTDNPLTDNPIAENRTQINTYILNKDLINTDSSSSHPATTETGNEEDDESVLGKLLYNYSVEEIRSRICHPELAEKYPDMADRLESIVQLMMEVRLTMDKSITIGGSKILADTVQRRYDKLRKEEIEAVLLALRQNKTSIQYPRAWLLTALYNAMPIVPCAPNKQNRSAQTSGSSLDNKDLEALFDKDYH